MPLTTIYGDGNGTRVIGSTSMGLFPQPLHPDVAAYVGNQVANGYSPSRARVDALNNLVYELIGGGVYDKFQVIYPFLGGTTANAQKWNLKNAANTDAAFRLSFTGSWTFSETGIVMTSASQSNYARTFYTPSVNATNTDSHLSVYIRNQFTGTGCPIGGIAGSQATSLGYQIFASTILNGSTMQAQNTSNIISFGTSSAGLYVGTITPDVNTPRFAYYNGNQTATATGSQSLAGCTAEIYLGLRNNGSGNPTVQWPTTSEIALATIGLSLNKIQVRNYYIAVQAYQTTLGRQV
jgi:hypothetical protein